MSGAFLPSLYNFSTFSNLVSVVLLPKPKMLLSFISRVLHHSSAQAPLMTQVTNSPYWGRSTPRRLAWVSRAMKCGRLDLPSRRKNDSGFSRFHASLTSSHASFWLRPLGFLLGCSSTSALIDWLSPSSSASAVGTTRIILPSSFLIAPSRCILFTDFLRPCALTPRVSAIPVTFLAKSIDSPLRHRLASWIQTSFRVGSRSQYSSSFGTTVNFSSGMSYRILIGLCGGLSAFYHETFLGGTF